MRQSRLLLALGLGTVLGFSLAITSGVLAQRTPEGLDGLPVDELRLMAEVLDRVKADYVERVDDQQLMQHAIQGMVAGLDPHSSFLDAGEYEDIRIATEGNYTGIGVEVSIDSGAIVIIAPLDGSPAARAGLVTGDAIIAVDGQVVDGPRLADAIQRMRGEPGTRVRVTIEREGVDEPLDVEMTRARLAVTSVTASLLDANRGYLKVSRFSDATGNEVEAALRRLQREAGRPLEGLVLDLRNNPGGVLEAAADVADAFLDGGVIVTATGRSSEARFVLEARPGDVTGGAPVVVLVNGGSASAAEIVAGALQDQRRALVVGRTTFGKGSVQTVLPLSDGRALKLTTSRYFTPAGRSIHEKGIEPDLRIDRPAQAAGALPAGGTTTHPLDDPEVRHAVAALVTAPQPRFAGRLPPLAASR